MYVTVCCEFSLVSDLHLEQEIKPLEIPVLAPYIVLCGDIGLPGSII
jgi:hypothetical protein